MKQVTIEKDEKQKAPSKWRKFRMNIKSRRDEFEDLQSKYWFVRWPWKIVKLFLEIVIIVLIVVTIVFLLVDSAPGKPAISASLPGPAAIAIEKEYGLNGPLITRYFTYIGKILTLDFGVSISVFPGVKVTSFIWDRFLTTATVGVISLAMTLSIGIPIGVLVGKNPGKALDATTSIIIAIFISVPALVFALLLLLSSRGIGLPYIYQPDNVLSWITPAFALALPSTISYIKYIRTSLNNEIKSMHAKFAYLKGTSRSKFVWRHALKPALFPIATFFPFVIIGVFVGSLFVERIFQIPGSGFLMTDAAQSKDVYLLIFIFILFTIMTILAFKTRDWLYKVLDPRLRGRK